MTEDIINFVQECPWLYDASRADFRDSTKKLNSWKKLAELLKTDVQEVKKRWRSLRTSYVREKHRKPSGSAAVEKKPWVYMEALNFLQDHVKEKKETFNNFSQEIENQAEKENISEAYPRPEIIEDLDTENEVECEINTSFADNTQEIFLQSVPSTPLPSTPLPSTSGQLTKRIIRKRKAEVILNSLEQTDNLLKKLCVEDNEDEHFSQLMKFYLKDVPTERKLDIHLKLLSVLREELAKNK
ncbi:uncharacterized protein [Parasteatoda tepidariorum]|uniref:uncharacterized protein n=1 Tax=Parasteatoda tepidariorum TaxID=114398 RepID=UPI001C71860E|nr:uncharacterized protein LOC107456004 [Parasteatoda tepidariorum]